MIIFSARMLCLRVAREALLRRGHVHSATFRQRFWPLFHHAAAQTLAVGALMIVVVGLAPIAPLVPPPWLADLTSPCLLAARERAIRVATITSRAQEEDLLTLGESADYVTK